MSAHSRGTGKWGDPSVPKWGWRLLDIVDLGEDCDHHFDAFDTQICEMCENTPIRYVHKVEHDTYGKLEIGCICCSHLTQDFVKPRRLEKAMRMRFVRRRRFVFSPRWRKSRKGNPYIKSTDGFYIVTIFPKPGGYGLMIKERGYDASPRFGSKVHKDLRHAAWSAFDALEWLRDDELKDAELKDELKDEESYDSDRQ